MFLSELNIDCMGQIIEIKNKSFEPALFEFGILPGKTFKIFQKTTNNGPICLELDSTKICIRKNLASQIVVRKIQKIK